ncbi:MAG TPA: DUF308 domain-containing protein [Candidatus Limnocylindrales bacterium]|jgi:uncharacterized membrane protein HdeD (DUF308 family)|nr:DUF308 domain-containing protein [Candidatus Limnocylindrales bacterium]
MVRLLIKNWWLILLRGIVALAFGIFIFLLQPFFPSALLNPMAYTALAVIFGLLACGTGSLTLIAALRGAQKPHDTTLLLADGLVALAAGSAVLLIPGLSLSAVIRIIAVTAMVLGLLELLAGTHLRRHITDEWLLIAGGAVSVVFSLFLFMTTTWELAGILSWVALYAIAAGISMLGLAIRLRGQQHLIHEIAKHQFAKHAANEEKPKAA